MAASSLGLAYCVWYISIIDFNVSPTRYQTSLTATGFPNRCPYISKTLLGEMDALYEPSPVSCLGLQR